jgi:hypothetical protein
LDSIDRVSTDMLVESPLYYFIIFFINNVMSASGGQ